MNHFFDSLGLEEDFFVGSRGTLVVYSLCSPIIIILSILKGKFHAGLYNFVHASLIVLLQLNPGLAPVHKKSFVFVLLFLSLLMVIARDDSIVKYC